MKTRKVLGIIGIVLSFVALFGVMVAPINPLWALVPAVAFLGCLLLLCINPREVDEEEEAPARRRFNWRKVLLWTLAILALASTILVAIFFGWFCLIPLAILFGILFVMTLVFDWQNSLATIFLIAMVLTIVIGIILWGVYDIAGRNNCIWENGKLGTVHVDNLVADNATIGNQTVTNENVTNEVVENQTVTNQTVDNQNATNQVVENQTVTNQVVENQTVTNQVVGNQTVVEPTEPVVTEPPATHPPATEPVHTHSYTSVVTEPTCMGQGYTTYTCSCGHSYKDSYKGALGHSYKSTVVAPTTSAGGYTEHKCERCGHTYKDNYTDMLPEATEPEVSPAIKCASTIRYGETVYVNLEGIDASNLKVSNRAFVSVEIISSSRVAITLTEDVTGYITITDKVSGTNVVIDIVEA